MKSRTPIGADLRGRTTTHLLLRLPRMLPKIKTLTFTSYAPSPVLEDRLTTHGDLSVRRVVAKALSLRQELQLDVLSWELIFALAVKHEDGGRILEEALRHSPAGFQCIEINSPDLTEGRLADEDSTARSGGRVLAICSRCILRDGTVGHIPMMDFRCQPRRTSLNWIIKALRALGEEHGAILESGHSYHFYGFRLLDGNEWLHFLAKCLLLAPLVDTRYIAHRLLHGTCVLRLGVSAQKPVAPRIVRVF